MTAPAVPAVDATVPPLSARVLDLPPDPDEIAETVSDALGSLREGTLQNATVDALVHETTRIALNWMGTGNRSALDALLQNLRGVLATAEVGPVLLSGLGRDERLAVKVLELGRVVSVYLRSSNTSRDVGALGGARRARWRAVMAWACGLDGPFTATDVRDAGFYAGRTASANEALDAMAREGLLARIEGNGVAYAVTLEGRNACRAVVGRDGAAEWAALPRARAALEAQRAAVEADRAAVEAERAAVGAERLALESKRQALLALEDQLAEGRRALDAERQEWTAQAQTQTALEPAY